MTDSPDLLSAAISETVAASDLLQARLARTLTTALDQADQILKHGAQPVKLRLINSIVGNAVRDNARRQGEDETRAKAREEVQQLFGAVLEGLQIAGRRSTVEDSPQTDARTDSPKSA